MAGMDEVWGLSVPYVKDYLSPTVARYVVSSELRFDCRGRKKTGREPVLSEKRGWSQLPLIR